MRLLTPMIKATFLSVLAQALPQNPEPPTNPWAVQCPVPASYTISNFTSQPGFNGSAGYFSLKISYGIGTFTCPISRYLSSKSSGTECDSNGLATINSDGFSWIDISEWFWCLDVPQQHDSMSTLATSARFSNLGAVLTCNKNQNGTTICKQTESQLQIPVQEYGRGGIIGFTSEDLNGNAVACPYSEGQNPIIQNTTTCEHYGGGAPN
ncbi:hypothetical protein N431DRAFT_464906 [Stipitochalara longipes BDJ]|nr:hypothetical protein N431DRAFT_464906 [Stipitochalara longipes BDJ]